MIAKHRDRQNPTRQSSWKTRVIAVWYMWQLYARITERIGFQWGDAGSSTSLPAARMGYDLFWPAFLLFPFIPLKNIEFFEVNIVCIAYLSLMMISGTFAVFSHGDKTKRECENLKKKGYWYPEFMIKSPGRAMIFILIETVVQAAVIFLFAYFVIYKH